MYERILLFKEKDSNDTPISTNSLPPLQEARAMKLIATQRLNIGSILPTTTFREKTGKNNLYRSLQPLL